MLNFTELKAEITKLKEASKHSDIDPSKYKTTLKEVSILRQQLCASENEKKEVQNVWKEKLEQSEKRKAEEINELKVKQTQKKLILCRDE